MPYRDLKAVALTTQPSRREAAFRSKKHFNLNSPNKRFLPSDNPTQVSTQDKKLEGHRLLEHTTDAYIEAWGRTLERAFAQAAEGMYETMANFEAIDPFVEGTVQVDGHDKEELLYNWLEHLLLEFDIKQMVYTSFDISITSDAKTIFKLQANLKGEKYDRQKHGAKMEIKGVTYHLMEIQETLNQARVRFILDL
jgi:SHS2 domain-containing protein